MITVTGGLIMTAGPYAQGIRGINGSDSNTGESGNVVIHVADADIRTTYKGPKDNDPPFGLYASNEIDGDGGDVTVTLTNTDVSTMGPKADAVHAGRSYGDGNVIVNVQGGEITTNHYNAKGIYGWHNGSEGATGDVRIDLQSVTIKTNGKQLVPDQDYTLGHGAYAYQARDGDINIVAGSAPACPGTTACPGTAISTQGAFSYGLRAFSAGEGDIQVTTHEGSSITNTGTSGHGIDARNTSTNVTDDTRSITITVGGDITASGKDAHGVRIGTGSAGFVGLDDDGYRRQTVTVNGRVTGGSGSGAGIYLSNGGKVFIGPQGSIGADSGIAILATGDDASVKPKLWVDMNLDGRKVAEVIGDDWIINDGGETTIIVNKEKLHDGEAGVVLDSNKSPVKVANGAFDVSIRKDGLNVVNINTLATSERSEGIIGDRDFSAADFNETRRPTPPPPVPELQVFRVEEPVFGGADDVAGIYIEGDGIVYIGPMGSIRAESGIAILATEGAPGSLSNSSSEGLLFGDVIGGDVELRSAGAESGIATLTTGDGPKLTVDMDLDGRRVQDVIGDDWIMNDQGETTLIVNDVKLHDGETGVVTDAKAPNGAFDVMIRAEGVTVDRTDPDPANWMISDPALGIIADRDFSAEDFIYLPTSGSPLFVEEYAPRSAVYESLPGFLLRMADRGRLNHRPVSPVWMVFSGGNGSVDPSRSTTGAQYDYDRYRVQLGKNLIFGEGLDGWFAVHYTQGDSEVSSPTGGGDIDVNGVGATLDIQWQHASGYYLGGHTSFTAYDVDLSSDDVGRLRSSVDALGTSLGFEAGRQMAIGETFQMTPRAWLSHSSIDIDSFIDAVDAKASFPDEVRLTGGIGALAQTMQPWKGGELTWHGSLDIEQILNSRSTTATANVSGEPLKTETVSTRLLLGLGSLYQKGDFSISTQISADGLGTNDEEYSGQVKIGVRL